MSDTVIKVENLSKRYRIGSGDTTGYKTIRETIVEAFNAPFNRIGKLIKGSEQSDRPSFDDTFWALKDVSFEVTRGEVVGIIGRNGAGKSTLLKILSKITEPTTGRVELRGRVGSLLEVGTGFHPELTGHENVYLYGAILGMDRWEISRKFDEIIAFAELEKFIDIPVKRYSSGMYMRLAFAVAAHLEPEILLVDEVLAVGDAAFQKKCLGKMGEVSKQGRTVLFVSHNMAAIANLCDSAILLETGGIKSQGSSYDMIDEYLTSYVNLSATIDLNDFPDRKGSGEAQISSASILSNEGTPCNIFNHGDDICFQYTLTASRPMNLVTVVMIKTSTGIPVLHLANHDDPKCKTIRVISELTVKCTLKNCQLLPGNYFISIWAAPDHHHTSDSVNDILQFRIEQGKLMERGFDMSWKHGIYHTRSYWTVEPADR